jgi:hypothetical protein
MATKKIIEKKTGEVYASKAAMAKHEKGESKATQKKEIKKGPVAKQLAKHTVKATVTKKAPAKMKKC